MLKTAYYNLIPLKCVHHKYFLLNFYIFKKSKPIFQLFFISLFIDLSILKILDCSPWSFEFIYYKDKFIYIRC